MAHKSVKAVSVVPPLLKKIMDKTPPDIKYNIIDHTSSFSFGHTMEGVGIDRLIAVEGALSLYKPPFVIWPKTSAAGSAGPVCCQLVRPGRF